MFEFLCDRIPVLIVSCLLQQRSQPSLPSVSAQLQFAIDIASGMAHLRSLGIVHGNLSAFAELTVMVGNIVTIADRRTVLVSSDDVCKLSDIGLNHEAYGGLFLRGCF